MQNIKDVYTTGYARTFVKEDDYRLLKVLEITKKYISKKSVTRILDVGCGDGLFALELAKVVAAKEVFGIDISEKAVAIAVDNGVSAVAMDVDVDDFPFESGYFDLVYCGNLIELVLDPDHLLQELYRVLSTSGFLIITYPNICAWASRLAVLFGFNPYYYRVSRRYDLGKLFIPVSEGNSTGFIRLYSVYSFHQITKLYGIRIIKTFGAREQRLSGFMSLVDRFMSIFPSLAFQVICVVIKEQTVNQKRIF